MTLADLSTAGYASTLSLSLMIRSLRHVLSSANREMTHSRFGSS